MDQRNTDQLHDGCAATEWDFVTARLSREKAHRQMVALYLSAVAAASQPPTSGPEETAVGTFAQLREARLIELHPAVINRMVGEIDAYVDNKIGGLPEGATKDDLPREFADRIDAAAAAIAFPDPLPFPSCWFGWGMSFPSLASIRLLVTILVGLPPPPGMDMTQEQVDRIRVASGHTRVSREVAEQRWLWRDGMAGCWTRGYLLTADGGMAEFVENQNHTAFVTLVHKSPNETWTKPWISLAPWIANVLVATVNDADTLVREGERTFSYRREFEKASKIMGRGKRVLPRPFYIVDVKPTTQTVRQLIKKSMPRAWHFRWDVRGHWVTRVLGGLLPIDPKLMRKLARRHYWVFTAVNPPTGGALRVLLRHRMPLPRLDEWVAVQQVWRHHFIKGPEGKPYIPSTHRVVRGKEAKHDAR